MKQVQCLLLKGDKCAVGFVEELEKVYEIEGFYIQALTGENTGGIGGAEYRGTLQYVPFSPVGGTVSKLKIPKANVVGFQQLPDSITFNIQYMLTAEVRNIERRRMLSSMRVPGRNGLSPDETLALINQFVEKHGELPRGNHAVENMGGVSGTFDVLPVSPYREEA